MFMRSLGTIVLFAAAFLICLACHCCSIA